MRIGGLGRATKSIHATCPTKDRGVRPLTRGWTGERGRQIHPTAAPAVDPAAAVFCHASTGFRVRRQEKAGSHDAHSVEVQSQFWKASDCNPTCWNVRLTTSSFRPALCTSPEDLQQSGAVSAWRCCGVAWSGSRSAARVRAQSGTWDVRSTVYVATVSGRTW